MLAVVDIDPTLETYPVVSMPPESPNCKYGCEVPFVLTPLNITVIRFAVDTIPVKSTLVPDADTAVPCLIWPETAPLNTVVPFAVKLLLNVVAPVTVPPVNGSAFVRLVRVYTSVTTMSPAVQGLFKTIVVPFVAV